MHLYHFESEHWIPLPHDEVFDFFSKATNLERLMPDWLDFQTLSPPPIIMQEGTEIDYQFKLRFLKMKWRARIVDWSPPHQFVDEQTKGPYRFWRHKHLFKDVEGGCLIKDCVDYAVPLGWLIHRWWVRPDIERIFSIRKHAVEKALGPFPE